MAQPINLFGVGQQSKSPILTAQHRLNLYYDIQTDVDKTNVAVYGTPGLNLFCHVSDSPTRGLHWMESNNILYVVQYNSLYAVTFNGVSTFISSLAAADVSGRVSMANNGTQLCIVTGGHAYIYNTVTLAWTDITATIPYAGNVADTVTFLDGYFLINRPSTGQFFKSAVYDGLTWPALDYATAESNPDNLKSVVTDKGHLVLLGSSSIETWINSGAAAFPFARINSSPSEGGIAAQWSIAKCQGNITGLFRNRSGALAVCVLDGYTLVPISNADMNYLINGYTSPTDAVGFGYALNGRAFYQITFQAAGMSWLYDFQSNAWSQLKSWGITRHIGDLCAAFDTKLVVTDYDTGSLYTMSADTYTDNGATIERELVGGHTFKLSRNSISLRRLRVDMESGVGLSTGQGSDPQIMLQISRDGGHTWGGELWSGFGAIGSFLRRAEWRRLGVARDWVFKLRITDPVKVAIIAAIVEGQELNK